MGDIALRYIKHEYDSFVVLFEDFSQPILIVNEREFEDLYEKFKKQQKELNEKMKDLTK